MLLLTYALHNADCYAKNLALLCSSEADVRLSPFYDLLTTVVYSCYQNQTLGIAFMGKKTCAPGKISKTSLLWNSEYPFGDKFP